MLSRAQETPTLPTLPAAATTSVISHMGPRNTSANTSGAKIIAGKTRFISALRIHRQGRAMKPRGRPLTDRPFPLRRVEESRPRQNCLAKRLLQMQPVAFLLKRADENRRMRYDNELRTLRLRMDDQATPTRAEDQECRLVSGSSRTINSGGRGVNKAAVQKQSIAACRPTDNSDARQSPQQPMLHEAGLPE